MTERNTSQKKQRKAKPEFSIREELLKVIAAAKKEPAITNSQAQSRCLNKLVEFVQTDDIFVDIVGSCSMVGQFPPYISELEDWDGISLDDFNNITPTDYSDILDNEGLEIGTNELAEYLEISAEQLKTGIRVEKVNLVDALAKPPFPLPISECCEIFITRVGGKGRGQTYRFRRCKGDVFRLLNLLLNLRPATLCPELEEQYDDLTIRQILCKARDMGDIIHDLDDWMLPLMGELDIFATKEYGLIVADEGGGIKKVLKSIGWGNRDHVGLLKSLRSSERMPWGKFESKGQGECTALPWRALVFDLPNIINKTIEPPKVH